MDSFQQWLERYEEEIDRPADQFFTLDGHTFRPDALAHCARVIRDSYTRATTARHVA